MGEQGLATRSTIRTRDDSRALWMLGGLYQIRLSGEDTGGALTCMEITVPAGGGPPPHRHSENETVYVLEGKGIYHIGDEHTEVGPGSIVNIPTGTLETFEPVTEMRVLITYMPGGADRFFAEAGEPALRNELPPPMTAPPDFERLAAIGAKYGLELQKPPGM